MKTRRFRSKRKSTCKSTRKHKRHTKRHTKRHYKGGGPYVRNTSKELLAALIAKYKNPEKQNERINKTECKDIAELQALLVNKKSCNTMSGTLRREEPPVYEDPDANEKDPVYEVFHASPPKTRNPNYKNNPFLFLEEGEEDTDV